MRGPDENRIIKSKNSGISVFRTQTLGNHISCRPLERALRSLEENQGSTKSKEPPNCFFLVDSMADPELEAIRQRRMQELMAQHGMGNQQNSEQQKVQEDTKREAEERRQLMLSQILQVKHEKDVSEEKLISLLEQINNQTSRQTKVTIQRRQSVLEDDD
ncbi:DNA-binding protein [Quillaja saponaria]|uniref:DNA-binding protein n=1 Tax=Quillaja saponaria TaxID=32244 RepID=A0AAD7KWE5_QUISA|nr:DNA-binding protein [Quillaja saponaria]